MNLPNNMGWDWGLGKKPGKLLDLHIKCVSARCSALTTRSCCDVLVVDTNGLPCNDLSLLASLFPCRQPSGPVAFHIFIDNQVIGNMVHLPL